MNSRECPTCGRPPSERAGTTGRLPKYCDLHAPPGRDQVRAWQRRNRDRIAAYVRAREGSRPTLAYECASCGKSARGWIGDGLCSPCRSRVRRWRPASPTVSRSR